MFSLFKSKRNRWRDESSKLFDIYITSLEGLDSSEIGALLNLATHCKNMLFQNALQNSDFFTVQALVDPVSLPEDKGMVLLQVWHDRMMRPSEPQKVAVVGALSIWWLSLAAGTFAELRIRGKEMWAELARGFPHSEAFSPYDDIPKGMGKIPSDAKTRMTLKDQFEVGAITPEQYLAALESENAELRAQTTAPPLEEPMTKQDHLSKYEDEYRRRKLGSLF